MLHQKWVSRSASSPAQPSARFGNAPAEGLAPKPHSQQRFLAEPLLAAPP